MEVYWKFISLFSLVLRGFPIISALEIFMTPTLKSLFQWFQSIGPQTSIPNSINLFEM